MPRLLETVVGTVTAPGATLTALTMAAGSSNQVRSGKPGSLIKLLAAWANNNAAGIFRMRSSRLHDAAQGIRLRILGSDPVDLVPYGNQQRLYPGDILTLELSGSAVGGQIETACMLMYYDDVDGSAARLIGYDEVMKRAVNLEVIELAITSGAGGGFTGERAINGDFDTLKAGTDYALMGYTVSARTGAICWRGVDSGNARVGGPGFTTFREMTANWFANLARRYAMPLIPVFNANNRAAILVDTAQDQGGAAVTTESMLVELAPA
jgi:hypothetical protein